MIRCCESPKAAVSSGYLFLDLFLPSMYHPLMKKKSPFNLEGGEVTIDIDMVLLLSIKNPLKLALGPRSGSQWYLQPAYLGLESCICI